ncbi:hypothetical protein [Flavobacterium sp.]|uniref:hypothetical protein n=1 Tax=Flavobacterium sp. TaxID=239 RepID=UPI0025FD4743|nr:hypothetical protein [Flavobacterium sp.]
MKKIFLFVCLSIISGNAFSQKSKALAKKTTSITAFPKVDNLQVEVKNGNFQISISEKGKNTTAFIVKVADATFAPKDCKLRSFMADGIKLYLLTWTENNMVKSGQKTEDKTLVYNTIYELSSKKQVYSNCQVTNHISERVSLGGTAASETQEKIRREGFEFVLNADGSITHKSKNQQTIFVYDKDKMEFKKN